MIPVKKYVRDSGTGENHSDYRGLSVRYLICLLAVMLIGSGPLYSFSDQTTTERILRENKGFINFIDVCVTNFGKEKIADIETKFKKIYQAHFNAQVAYLQSEYKNSYYNIRRSQKQQIDMTSDVLKQVYLEDAKVILDKLAPAIIRSKNARSRLYLTLGYRDRAVGRNYEIVADASNPKLYSYKIFRYIEGIKLARRAKRYGFLALYESRDKNTKKEIFDNLFKAENDAGNKFYRRFLNKSEQDFYKELNLTYEEYETASKKATESREKGQQESPQQVQPAAGDGTDELNVEKRVRFRKERVTAKFLLHAEYERAEEVIREYVKDFNFKLILATLKVLGSKGQQDSTNYNSYIPHHYDNYGRLYKSYGEQEAKAGEGSALITPQKKSMLDIIAGDVKVVGDINRNGEPADNRTLDSGSGAAQEGQSKKKEQQK